MSLKSTSSLKKLEAFFVPSWGIVALNPLHETQQDYRDVVMMEKFGSGYREIKAYFHTSRYLMNS